jgi:hypothetical protein
VTGAQPRALFASLCLKPFFTIQLVSHASVNFAFVFNHGAIECQRNTDDVMRVRDEPAPLERSAVLAVACARVRLPRPPTLDSPGLARPAPADAQPPDRITLYALHCDYTR